MEKICPNCKTKQVFEYVDDTDKVKCSSCNAIYKKCANNACNSLTKNGFFCADCIGKGAKRIGNVALPVLLFVVTKGKFKKK